MIAAALATVAVLVGALMGRSEVLPPPVTAIAAGVDEPAGEDRMVRVHVSGQVVAPGVVDVAADAIVADAIEAAGGLSSDAIVDQINLAAPVVPGGQIVVPGGEDAGSGTGGAADGIVSLNQATAEDLESLPGVGPVLAERIASFRDENGGFEVVEDLLQVPGIGEAKLAAIRDLVRP